MFYQLNIVVFVDCSVFVTLAHNVPGAEVVSEFTDKSSCEAQNLDSRKMWIRSTKPLMAFAPC